MTGTEGPFHDPEPDSRAPHAQRPAVPEIAAQGGSSGTIRRRDASHGEERRSPAGVVSTSGGEDPESLLDAIHLTTDRIRTGALGRALVRAAQLSHIHARFGDLCDQRLDLGVVARPRAFFEHTRGAAHRTMLDRLTRARRLHSIYSRAT